MQEEAKAQAERDQACSAGSDGLQRIDGFGDDDVAWSEASFTSRSFFSGFR
jgi:hypothetical protein